MADQNWDDWKFQIHWNKLEWVNTRSCIEGNNPFCVSPNKFIFKDNNKTAHWVGFQKLKPLDINIILRKTIINELQASLTGDTIEHSYFGTKKSRFITRS